MSLKPEHSRNEPSRDCARPLQTLTESPLMARGKVLTSVCLLALSLAGCQKKPEERRMMPPEVEVTDAVEQDIPIYSEWIAQLMGPAKCPNNPQGPGLSAQAELSERLLRQDGPTDVRDRSPPVSGFGRSSDSASSRRSGKSFPGRHQREPRSAAGGTKRDSPKAARYRRRHPGCQQGAGRGRTGTVGAGKSWSFPGLRSTRPSPVSPG